MEGPPINFALFLLVLFLLVQHITAQSMALAFFFFHIYTTDTVIIMIKSVVSLNNCCIIIEKLLRVLYNILSIFDATL